MSGESLIITCQKCSEPLEASWERCPVCLTPTSSRGFLCPNCQSPIKETWKICPHCNTTLSGLETPTPSGPPSAVENSVPNKEQIYVSMIENEPVATIGFGLDLPLTEGDMLQVIFFAVMLGVSAIIMAYIKPPRLPGRSAA